MLYLVPTPIGNLEDITLRALRILKEVDIIACEDTRTSGKLLSHYNINTHRTSLHMHNEKRKSVQLVEKMLAGESIALISDAGAPGISDPAYMLVKACIEAGVKIEALPGATAFVPALTASGLITDKFVFEGFLPVKKGRQKRLKALSEEERTIIFYESPHRLVKSLNQMKGFFGENRKAVVAREISKKFEELKRGTLTELEVYYGAQEKVRGEIVLLVAGLSEEKPAKRVHKSKYSPDKK